MKHPVILANPQERDAERNVDQHTDLVVKRVEYKPTGVGLDFSEGVGLDFEGGTGIFITAPEGSPRIEKGDTIRAYGGLGFTVHGMSLLKRSMGPGGVVLDLWIPIYYRTKREQEVDHALWIAEHQERQHEEFEKGKAQLDALYDALPDPLKNRIDRFRKEDLDFRWKEEAYEMASCAEAGRLYKRAMDPEFGVALKAAKIKGPTEEAKKKAQWDWATTDGIRDWEDTPENRLLAFDAINTKLNGYKYDLMKTLMPEMSDGHSGNTWGHAVMFALRLVQGKGDLL